MRGRHVREMTEERLVVPIDAIAKLVVRRLVGKSQHRVQDRPVAFGERAQVDVDDVVFEPPAVRESGEVAREDTKPASRSGSGAWNDAGIEPQEIGLPGPGEVQPWYARQQDCYQIGAPDLGNRHERSAHV